MVSDYFRYVLKLRNDLKLNWSKTQTRQYLLGLYNVLLQALVRGFGCAGVYFLVLFDHFFLLFTVITS